MIMQVCKEGAFYRYTDNKKILVKYIKA